MEDKYTFETTSSSEMKLVVSRHKLVLALEELSRWRRDLCKGYDNNIQYLCEGKLYNQQDMFRNQEIPRDENGFIKDSKTIYEVNDIIDNIDNILYDVKDLLD